MSSTADSMSKQFYFNVNKYLDTYIERFVSDIESTLKDSIYSWKSELDSALGHDIPSSEPSHGKTNDRSRLFPYRRTGDLQSTPTATVRATKRDRGTRLYISASIDSPKSDWTSNLGDGAWTGWKEAVLFGNGRGSVPSLREVFAEFVRARRNVRRV